MTWLSLLVVSLAPPFIRSVSSSVRSERQWRTRYHCLPCGTGQRLFNEPSWVVWAGDPIVYLRSGSYLIERCQLNSIVLLGKERPPSDCCFRRPYSIWYLICLERHIIRVLSRAQQSGLWSSAVEKTSIRSDSQSSSPVWKLGRGSSNSAISASIQAAEADSSCLRSAPLTLFWLRGWVRKGCLFNQLYSSTSTRIRCPSGKSFDPIVRSGSFTCYAYVIVSFQTLTLTPFNT